MWSSPRFGIAKRSTGAVAGRAVRDPLTTARKYIAEAEDRVARQEALVLRLLQDKRRRNVAAKAKEILDTLKHSIRLAREHLSIELTNNSHFPWNCLVNGYRLEYRQQRSTGAGGRETGVPKL